MSVSRRGYEKVHDSHHIPKPSKYNKIVAQTMQLEKRQASRKLKLRRQSGSQASGRSRYSTSLTPKNNRSTMIKADRMLLKSRRFLGSSPSAAAARSIEESKRSREGGKATMHPGRITVCIMNENHNTIEEEGPTQ